jgi:hypothetical protein
MPAHPAFQMQDLSPVRLTSTITVEPAAWHRLDIAQHPGIRRSDSTVRFAQDFPAAALATTSAAKARLMSTRGPRYTTVAPEVEVYVPDAVW